MPSKVASRTPFWNPPRALALEHGEEDAVGARGEIFVAEDVMGHQEMEDVAGRDAAVHVVADRVRAVLAFGKAKAVGLEVIGAPDRDEHGRHAEVEPRESRVGHFFPEAVEDPAGEPWLDQAVLDGQAVERRRGVVVESAVAVLPPGEPAALAVEERLRVDRLEAVGESRVERRLVGTAELLFEVGERPPGPVDEGVGVAVLMAAVERVPPGVGAVGLLKGVGGAGLGRLDEAVPVDVAAGQEVGHALEELDAAAEPVEVSG